MKKVNVNNLHDGDILGRDLYRDNTLILKEGKPLTKKVINKLKQWRYKTIVIKDNQIESEEINNSLIKEEQFILPKNNISNLKNIFFSNLSSIGHEHRYGKALHKTIDYFWLENLFINHMSKPNVCKLLDDLKKWDLYTYQHSFDVFILGTLFAREINLPNIEIFSLGCLLHDIGKIDIPKSILIKPQNLSPKEFNFIKCHTIYGHQILSDYNFPEEICNLAKSHHERLDGSGYPEGLKSNQIDESTKALGLIDVYSALTLKRPYRNAYGSPIAEKILIKECNLSEMDYYYKFFKMLEIFPLNSTVELTNGIKAKIVEVNHNTPSFPILRDIYNDSRKIKMPLNKSVKISKLLNI